MIHEGMKILPQIIPVGLIIIPHQVKITHFHFIPSKYGNHYHGMILESIIFILKRYGYYTSVFAVWPFRNKRKLTVDIIASIGLCWDHHGQMI